MTLLETYAKRLAVADKVHAKSHNGEHLTESKKIMTAKVLENTNKFLNEAFENSVGTQRSDLGMYKRFALNLTTCALPNLIAPDLVLVYPMSSMSGYMNYLKYTAGTNKGATAQGKLINGVFQHGAVDVNYTGDKIGNEAKPAISDATAAYTATLNWIPVLPKTVDIINGTKEFKDFDGDGKLYLVGAGGAKGAESGAIVYKTGVITINANKGEAAAVSVNYGYDNQVVPQNDLPIINAEMDAIPLIAHARRIAVYYSNLAAYQAKQDYGFDLGESLAAQAVGELAYEIDTEVVNLLVDHATDTYKSTALQWNKAVPTGISKAQHFEGFAEIVDVAAEKVYNATLKFQPNYMLVSRSMINVIKFLKDWSAAPAGEVNGPYFAGTLGNIKVFVTPVLTPSAAEATNKIVGKYVLGVNGKDAMTSAAVYAPYMAIVPTQLLQYADGGTTQGWSTLYDLKILNADANGKCPMLIAGQVIDDITAQNSGTVYTATQSE